MAREAYRALRSIVDSTVDSILVLVVPEESLEKTLYTGKDPRPGGGQSIVL